MNVSKEAISIRNYIDDPQEDQEATRSCYELTPNEFEEFSITSEGKYGFSYSDFRAFVFFAEQAEINIRMRFGEPGQPISLVFKSSTGLYKVGLFAATILDDENYGQSTESPAIEVVGSDLCQIEKAASSTEGLNVRARKTRANRISSLASLADEDGSDDASKSNFINADDERARTLAEAPSNTLPPTVVGPITDPISMDYENESAVNAVYSLLPKSRHEEVMFETESQKFQSMVGPTPESVAGSHHNQSFRIPVPANLNAPNDDFDDDEVVPASPGSDTKRARLFGRCFSRTYIKARRSSSNDGKSVKESDDEVM